MKRTAKGEMDVHVEFVGGASHELWLHQINPFFGNVNGRLYITSKDQAKELLEILQGWINASPEELTKEWYEIGND